MPVPSSPAAAGSPDDRSELYRDLTALDEELEADAADEVDLWTSHVTAVLVAHDGEQWLPEALAGLTGQTRPPDTIVAVDTGSTDATSRLLGRAVGSSSLVTVDRASGFGQAVASGLAAVETPASARAEQQEWLWLLHDDCAPAPDALEQLLRFAATAPTATILGPKALDWDDPRQLVEVGLTTDTAGRRETGLERHELDQGQHDAPRDVLAVGTAGMLIRRSAWDSLGGLDPELPIFRDDIDLGWRAAHAGMRVCVVPAAEVRHARAAAHGRRTIDALNQPAHRADRRHALYVVLANASPLGFALGVPRLALAVVLRALVQLLTRRPHAARDEMSALGLLAGAVVHLGRSRKWRKPQRTAPASAVRPLLAGRSHRLRGYAEAVGDWLSGGAPQPTGPGSGALESGPSDDDALLPDDSGLIRRVLARRGVLLILGLTFLSLVASRHLLGSGSMVGGRLLPVPSGSADLWHRYASAWQQVGAGSSTPPAPWLPWLGALSWLLLGKAWLAVDVLLIGCVPLAAFSAYRATRGLIRSDAARLWAAITYGLLPVATGSVAAGRFDAAVVVIGTPPLLRAGRRLLTADPRSEGWWHSWATGLGLALVSSFWPPLWPLAGVLLVGGFLVAALLSAPVEAGSVRRRGSAVLACLAVPPALALPWWPAVLDDPGVLVTGLGRGEGLGGTDALPRPLDLVALWPGGPGMPPVWVLVPVLLAALVGLARLDGRRWALALWAAALGSTGAALVVSRTAAGGSGTTTGWAGPAVAVASAAVLGAAVLGAEDARERLAQLSFGWRQLGAAILAMACLAVPVVLAGNAVARGLQDPLDRRDPAVLPPFVQVDALSSPGQRVLFLDRRSTGDPVRYSLTLLRGLRLADEDAVAPSSARRALDAAVADLTAPRGSDAGELLSTFGIGFVAVPSTVDPGLVEALDLQPALSRVAFEGRVRLWRLTVPVGRLQLLGPGLSSAAQHPKALTQGEGRGPSRLQLRRTPPVVLPAGETSARALLPAGPPGRLLVLAEPADEGWRATLDGKQLERVTAWGWAQGFLTPAGGGTLVVEHRDSGRRLALGLQLLLLVTVVVLAAPSLSTDEDEVVNEPEEPPAPPERAGSGRSSGNVRLAQREKGH